MRHNERRAGLHSGVRAWRWPRFLRAAAPRAIPYLAALFALIAASAWLTAYLAREVSIWAAAALAALAFCVFIYTFWIEPRSLRIRREEMTMAGLSAPLRIVAIGDVQPARLHWAPKRLRAAFAKAQALEPDLVLWLGDYAYSPGWAMCFGLGRYMRIDVEDVVAEMAALKGRRGVYAVLGNHDWRNDGPKIQALLEGCGVKVLVNAAERVALPGGGLWIAGIDDIFTPRPYDLAATLSAAKDDAPLILLSHSPDIFPETPPRAALTLSGHTHGGQVKLPLIGRLFAPIRHKRYAYGRFEEGGRVLMVTSGVGTSGAPARFAAPPEIMCIDLRPE